MKSKWVLVLLVVVLGAGIFGGTVLATPATPSPGLSTTILAKSTLDGPQKIQFLRAVIASHLLFAKSDYYVVDNKFAANATSGWHSHPGPSVVTVVAGTMTNYESSDENCTPHVYSAGTSFVDAGGSDAHMLRNESGAPAETIAVQLIPKDAARRIDVTPAPGNCKV
jgi:quercetin dioxygenase-like cupin family protein